MVRTLSTGLTNTTVLSGKLITVPPPENQSMKLTKKQHKRTNKQTAAAAAETTTTTTTTTKTTLSGMQPAPCPYSAIRNTVLTVLRAVPKDTCDALHDVFIEKHPKQE